MRRARVIEIDGHPLGATVSAPEGLRFLASHPRVKSMDRTVWSSAKTLRRAIERLTGQRLTGQRLPGQRLPGQRLPGQRLPASV